MGDNPEVPATAELLIEDMTDAERERARRVDSVLPSLADRAADADRRGEFPPEHVRTISDAGLLGLTVPVAYGGLGGGLRDLAGATFAMATACASTSMAYFFQCSGSSRGLLPLAAAQAGLFEPDDVEAVTAFGEKVLRRMGAQGHWVANFASESVRSKDAAITIATEASRTDGGWLINGVKSFGCATGVADDYLVTAKLEGGETAESLAVFLIPRDTPGVSERTKWDAIGMRATATHGIVLEDAFVPDENALTVPATFVKMTQVSRGSFVGNQVALSSVYIGAAQAVYDFALNYLRTTTYHDSDEPIGGSDLHRQLVGKMRAHLDTAYLWARRQIRLETADPEVIPKPDVVANWRIAKGEIADNCFAVAVQALKACGTGNTGMDGHRLPRACATCRWRWSRASRPSGAVSKPRRTMCSEARATSSPRPGGADDPLGPTTLDSTHLWARPAAGEALNRLASRPWFFAGMGAFLYLTGMNDEALHHLGNWWLSFGRWGQTAVVAVVLALIAYLTLDAVNRRRSAYRAALRAADATRRGAVRFPGLRFRGHRFPNRRSHRSTAGPPDGRCPMNRLVPNIRALSLLLAVALLGAACSQPAEPEGADPDRRVGGRCRACRRQRRRGLRQRQRRRFRDGRRSRRLCRRTRRHSRRWS